MGNGPAAGVVGTGGNDPGAVGILGWGGHGGGAGVEGRGTGNSSGVSGYGSAAAGGSVGVEGQGTDNRPGIMGTGGATDGNGVEGLGLNAGVGVQGTGGDTNGIGVVGVGKGSGVGVSGVGGTTSGNGVLGSGGSIHGIGVVGEGAGNGVGGKFTGGGSAAAIRMVPAASNPAINNGDEWYTEMVGAGTDQQAKIRMGGKVHPKIPTWGRVVIAGGAIVGWEGNNVFDIALSAAHTVSVVLEGQYAGVEYFACVPAFSTTGVFSFNLSWGGLGTAGAPINIVCRNPATGITLSYADGDLHFIIQGYM